MLGALRKSYATRRHRRHVHRTSDLCPSRNDSVLFTDICGALATKWLMANKNGRRLVRSGRNSSTGHIPVHLRKRPYSLKPRRALHARAEFLRGHGIFCCTMNVMNTTETTVIDPQDLADHEAVMRHLIDGTPVEPELARRVRERSQKLMEETRRKHGEIDVDALIHSVRDDV